MTAPRAADRILAGLAARPARAIAALAGYVLLVAATHDHVQDLAYWLQQTFTREVWTPAVAVLSALVLAVASHRAHVRSLGTSLRAERAAAWLATCALLVAAFLTLLATNMEAIHFVQYALPAWPLYAVTRRFGATVVLVAALGAFDEAWQYAVLHDGWGVPYDVNDVVLNTLGASLGCASVLAFGGFERARGRTSFEWPVAVLAVVGGGALALRAAGLLALYQGEGDAPLLLARVPRPEERWDSPDWGRGHYVLHPGQSLLIVVAIAAAWAWIDGRVARTPPEDRA